ncbi:MAG: HIT family protein [Candidatus Poribacteria bacterium]|nr:HIT family protein [Candidatus Poribacteria bacterium]
MSRTLARFEMPIWDPCPFCELAAGRSEIRHIIDATEKTLTFINKRQFEIGQLLVIPRRHAPTILDLTDDEAVEIMNKVRTAAEALIETFNPDGITVYQNNGVTSLQEVPHFHVHVVPRRKSSDWGSGPPHIAALQPENLEMKRKVTVSWKRAEEIASLVKLNFKTQ